MGLKSVLLITGAGISANAGISTYRDGGSSWKDSDLEAKSHSTRYGNHLDELWDKHWGPTYQAMNTAEPTHTHKAITEFQQSHDVIVATQNIDNLHERANNNNVAHLHGVMEPFCMKCKSELVNAWTGDGAPTCAKCGGKKTRPGAVLFGEMLNKKMMSGLEYFAQHEASHIIAIGTSLNVFPATGLLMDTLGKVGKTTIIVNKEPTAYNKWATKAYVSDCDSVIDEVFDSIDTQP